MTFFVKCDNCGKMQQAPYNDTGQPYSPINDETGENWYSKQNERKKIHACGRECIPKDEVALPL